MSGRKQLVRIHHDLVIYQIAFEHAMKVSELSKKLPVEERYSMTDRLIDQCVAGTPLPRFSVAGLIFMNV